MRQKLRRWGAILFGFALFQAPRLVLACSVCTAGRDEESQDAFLATTVFMSVLPLILVGALGWAVVRRTQHRGSTQPRSARALARSLEASP